MGEQPIPEIVLSTAAERIRSQKRSPIFQSLRQGLSLIH